MNNHRAATSTRTPTADMLMAQAAQAMLEADMGQLSPLETAVVESIRTQTLLVPSAFQGMEASSTLHEWLEDQVAKLVGSWYFFGAVVLFLVAWIGINMLFRPFEPYPAIVLAVLGATLATLGALHGPIIMMSQRRQRRREQMQVENDYQINLKAELEIRYLSAKLDEMLIELKRLKQADSLSKID